MELKQKLELRRFLAPELRQSLKILTLSLPDLKNMVAQEIEDNPVLDEAKPENNLVSRTSEEPSPETSSPAETLVSLKPRKTDPNRTSTPDLSYPLSQMVKKATLQDILLRQLGMFSDNDAELKIGAEIIGSLDENGYLKLPLEEISGRLNVPLEQVEKTLKLIQQFEPAGVAARNISECLLVQVNLANENDPLLTKIITAHLDDVAKKNYSHIAKALGCSVEDVETQVKKITRLDPKPGRNYSSEETQNIIPDIIINDTESGLEIAINNEDIPGLEINKEYRAMLRDAALNQQTKEFLSNKMRNAIELLRSISRRQVTLRKVVEAVVDYQQEALKTDLSKLRPLTFAEIAAKVGIHETTVCRVVMNKYVHTPFGIVSLKSFFPGKLQEENGNSVSDSQVKRLIKEIIDSEDKKHPESDQEITEKLLQQHQIKLARRTVAKYREELKILSSSFRKGKVTSSCVLPALPARLSAKPRADRRRTNKDLQLAFRVIQG
jgi:RNA polymerase sigma-54 factor